MAPYAISIFATLPLVSGGCDLRYSKVIFEVQVLFTLEWFCHEICDQLIYADVLHYSISIPDILPYIMLLDVNMFRAVVVHLIFDIAIAHWLSAYRVVGYSKTLGLVISCGRRVIQISPFMVENI